ncbi:MAG: HAD family hydrolase [Aquabacterium sp.]
MNILVFDFGGVLFHWHPPRLLRRELPHRCPDEAAAQVLVQAFFQSYGGDWGEFDRGSIAPEALVPRIAQRTGLDADEVRRVMDGVPRELAPIDASVALLDRTRRCGLPVYFLSNMPAPYADHLERAHPFVGWFTNGLFSGREGLIKPEPAIFDRAAQRFGQSPASLVFLDDHGPNVEAARAAGWRALQFRDAEQAETDLRSRGWWPGVD